MIERSGKVFQLVAVARIERVARRGGEGQPVAGGIERGQPHPGSGPLVIHHDGDVAQFRRRQRGQQRHIRHIAPKGPVRQHGIRHPHVIIICVRRKRARRPPSVNEQLLEIVGVARRARHKRSPPAVCPGRPASDASAACEDRLGTRCRLIDHRVGAARAVGQTQRQRIGQRIRAAGDLHNSRPLVPALRQNCAHDITRPRQGRLRTIGQSAIRLHQRPGPGVVPVGGHVDAVGRFEAGVREPTTGQRRNETDQQTVGTYLHGETINRPAELCHAGLEAVSFTLRVIPPAARDTGGLRECRRSTDVR